MKKIEVREYIGTIDATDAVAVINEKEWYELCKLCRDSVKRKDIIDWILTILAKDKLLQVKE